MRINRTLACIVCVALCFCFSALSVAADDTYDGSLVTMSLLDTTYADGKATLTLTGNFPKTDDGKFFQFDTVRFSFSCNNESLDSSVVYFDETNLKNNGKTNMARVVYLIGENGYEKDDEGNNIRYASLNGRWGSYWFNADVYSTYPSETVSFQIPLAISEDFSGTINVSATGKFHVYLDEQNPTYYAYNTDVNLTATITPGSGFSASTEVPSDDITDSTGGAATVTSSIVDGTATLNVASEKACVVAYTTDNGETYTRLNATANAASGYDFAVADYTDSMKFVVAVKGDLNGDGTINAAEAAQVKAAQLGKLTLTTLQSMAADLDGNGTINAAEAAQVKAAQLGKLALSW